MYYRLFTDSHALLGGPFMLVPLLCLLPMIVIGSAWLMGVDIRRSEASESDNFLPRLALHLLVTPMLSAIYIGLASFFAIQRGRGPDFSGWLGLVVGDVPPTINQPRILMLAVGHWMLILLANLMLYQNLQSGGWLRDRIDRMRNPSVQRGELGSSHFCTPREFKRYRLPDPEGMRFLGAFWGDGKQRLDAGQGMFCLNDSVKPLPRMRYPFTVVVR